MVIHLSILALLHNIPEIQVRYPTPLKQMVELSQESHDMLLQKDEWVFPEEGFPSGLSPC
jgi:hypothetical protein